MMGSTRTSLGFEFCFSNSKAFGQSRVTLGQLPRSSGVFGVGHDTSAATKRGRVMCVAFRDCFVNVGWTSWLSGMGLMASPSSRGRFAFLVIPR